MEFPEFLLSTEFSLIKVRSPIQQMLDSPQNIQQNTVLLVS
ncbi:MAG: hypothetical protein RM338_14620 [Nostoc sp. DedQUE12a]|nr:hypothetical protein [Nostoc sp. DedQUE12a]